MGLAESLYKKYLLKRVFFSAYLPVNSDSRLPALDVRPPLLREHRLYQADWLLRYYDFSAWELLTEEEPNFDPYLDPKCTWAVRHPEFFPVEINTAPKAALLRIPGIGPKSALRILSARRQQHLGMAELKRMGVVLKRAQYFITCNGRAAAHGTLFPFGIARSGTQRRRCGFKSVFISLRFPAPAEDSGERENAEGNMPPPSYLRA